MSSPQAEQWREAINKELSGLVALDTWELVPITSIPATANVMHCHLVFAIKRKADGSIDKFKARLVADGNTQKHGVDFNRVFATVIKALTIRLVLAIAAARDYNLTSLDIRQAYLQATINQDLTCVFPRESTAATTPSFASCGAAFMDSSRQGESGDYFSSPSLCPGPVTKNEQST